MNFFSIKFLILSILIALLQTDGYSSCLEKERIGLLDIKSFFISISEKEYAENILTSWVDDSMSDCCVWEGVQCNTTTNRVMELSLNLTREINSDNYSHGFPILNLSLFLPFQELQSLDLSNNDFEGWNENKAYYSFGNLKKLKTLNLGGNYFNDSVLSYLTTLTSLTTLILRYNKIQGLKPNKELANLRKLEVLDLRGNEITTIDSLTIQGLSKFRNLKALDLSLNHINGSLERQGICKLKSFVEVNLKNNDFEGRLPQCLNNFTRLKVLDISFNELSGNLPSVMVNGFRSLEYLDLSYNNFEGIFSLSSLANHSNLKVFMLSTESNMLQVKIENCFPTFQLKVLHLRSCNLNASISSFLLQQYDLRYLELSNNKLVGDFPTWLLQNNTKLEVLRLRNNSFTGTLRLPSSKHSLLHLDISSNSFFGKLPQNIGFILPKLVYIDMSKNSFEGNIPSSIGEMKELRLLDLSRNNFSGELPGPLVSDCISLMLLDLSNNNFYGKIFPKYMNLTQLQSLYLDNNKFSGKIDDGLLTSTELFDLDISSNMLSGHIPHWIGNFSYLWFLLMSNNRLEGSIPIQLNTLESLKILDISRNRLSASISSSLNLSSILHLYMQKNALGGLIPNVLLRSSTLMTLDLRDNGLFGRIPLQINEHSDLRVLLLGGNHLQGSVPDELCQLRKLGILDLSHNRLNGSIPSCFTNLLSWRVGNGDLYGSQLEYTLDIGVDSIGTYYNSTLDLMLDDASHVATDERVEVEFGTKNRYEFYNGSNLNYMAGLDLSCNQLTGKIPSVVGELQQIRGLNLSHNSLSGPIPKSFSNLKMIESLDLSHNKLSGQIPPQMTELNYLSTFNVSYNYLSGPTPDKGQFATFSDGSYRGNPGLCGETINKSCISSTVEEIPATTSDGGGEDESAIDMMSFNWSFGASYLTFVLGFFAILWVNSYWRRLWFCFVEACIDRCYYWLFKCVYFVRDHARP